jgi:hypothetical protein
MIVQLSWPIGVQNYQQRLAGRFLGLQIHTGLQLIRVMCGTSITFRRRHELGSLDLAADQYCVIYLHFVLASRILTHTFVLQTFGAGARRKFPNLTRWLQTMLWHPHAVAAIGVALQPPEKPVQYHEEGADAWGEGPHPFAQIMPSPDQFSIKPVR